jgi:hypothetical protein
MSCLPLIPQQKINVGMVGLLILSELIEIMNIIEAAISDSFSHFPSYSHFPDEVKEKGNNSSRSP